VQEWPQQMAGPRCHPGQGSATRSPSQAKQDRLRLVVKGVTEQNGGGPRSCLSVESAVSGLAGCGFRSHRGRLVHLNGGDSHILIPKAVELLPDAVGNLG
jgi:hypothetical protein